MPKYTTTAGRSVMTFNRIQRDGLTVQVGKPFTSQDSKVTGIVQRIDRRYNKAGRVMPNLFSICLDVDGVERWTTLDLTK